MTHWRGAILFSLLVGVVAFVGTIIALIVNPEVYFRSYLFAFLYFLGLALGSLSMSMVHHLVGGTWGVAVRRTLEAGAMTLPLMAVLFVPILFGLHALYPWARPELVANDPILRDKVRYLNASFFIVRAVIFFAGWILIALILRRWELRYDQSPSHALSIAIQKLSAGGLLIYILFMTFAGVDWILSRDAHYYSTIIGLIFVTGQSLTALSFAILVLCLIWRIPPLDTLVTAQVFIDLGSLLETLVILFAYISFSQFLVNYSGNSQQEITWYVRRTSHGWIVLAGLVILFHFFVPFFSLLMRSIKQRPELLGTVAAIVLAARWMDLFWMVAPPTNVDHPRFAMVWTDIAAPLGIGGFWLAAFLWILDRRPLVPRHSMALEDSELHGKQAPTAIH